MVRFKGQLSRTRLCGPLGIASLGQIAFPVGTTVENPKDCDSVGLNNDGDGQSAFEPDDPKAGSDVVASGSAFRCQIESAAIVLDPLDVAQRGSRTRSFGNPFVDLYEVSFSLWSEDDRAPPHGRSRLRLACRAFIRWKTSFAGRTRAGSAFTAS